MARNLAGRKFVSTAGERQLEEIYFECVAAVSKAKRMKGAQFYNMQQTPAQEREFLVEARRICKELDCSDPYKGAFVSPDGKIGVFVNEEDHIRIQTVGESLAQLYKAADAIDDEIEKTLEYAFSSDIGYITACPTNLGTGMRASVMLHLPALSIDNQVEKIVRALNQMGMIVRGALGEGSDSYNSYYQVSNQFTLGLSEAEIVKKVQTFCKKICQFETNARYKMLEDAPLAVADRISRARATLENCRLIDAEEAVMNISVLRMAADMNMMDNPQETVDDLDSMTLAVQPAHLCRLFGVPDADSDVRDALRAGFLNKEISKLPEINIERVV